MAKRVLAPTRFSAADRLRRARRTSVPRNVERANRDMAQARFEIYRDYAGRFRWRLRGPDARVAADSPQSFASRWRARIAAEEARRQAVVAHIDDGSV